MHGLLEIGRSQAGCFTCSSFQLVPTVQDTLMEAVESVCPPVFDQITSLDSPEETLAFLSSQCIYVNVDSEVSQLELNQDEVKFRQIAGNLIKNALHHRKKRVDIGLGCRNHMMWLEVSDDGPGIGAEHHEMIFRRYTQVLASDALSRTGHGLGLAGALSWHNPWAEPSKSSARKAKGRRFG